MGQIIQFPKKGPFANEAPAGQVVFVTLNTFHLFTDCTRLKDADTINSIPIAELKQLGYKLNICKDCLKHKKGGGVEGVTE